VRSSQAFSQSGNLFDLTSNYIAPAALYCNCRSFWVTLVVPCPQITQLVMAEVVQLLTQPSLKGIHEKQGARICGQAIAEGYLIRMV